jgi:hypothetical protein
MLRDVSGDQGMQEFEAIEDSASLPMGLRAEDCFDPGHLCIGKMERALWFPLLEFRVHTRGSAAAVFPTRGAFDVSIWCRRQDTFDIRI